MFEQTVELPAVQRAPGTVEVVSGLRLLPSVVVVLELDRSEHRAHSSVSERVNDPCQQNEMKHAGTLKRLGPGRRSVASVEVQQRFVLVWRERQ